MGASLGSTREGQLNLFKPNKEQITAEKKKSPLNWAYLAAFIWWLLHLFHLWMQEPETIYVRWEPSGSSPCGDLSLHLSLASSLFLLPLSVSSYKQFYQWCSLLPCLRDGSLFTRTYLDTENMLFFQESFWCVLIWDLHQQMRLGGRKNKQG